MKKIIMLIAGLSLVFALLGCGGTSSNDTSEMSERYEDPWEKDEIIKGSEEDDYYLIWKGEKDGLGKLIYEYDDQIGQEMPLFYVYCDYDGVYYSLLSENEDGKIEYVKVIDFYNTEWTICENTVGSIEECNFEKGYCVVKAKGKSESVYYMYDMIYGTVYEYNSDTKMKIFVYNPKIIKLMLEIINRIKKR